MQATTAGTFQCKSCDKICKTKRGLSRHQNTHKKNDKKSDPTNHPTKELLISSLPKLILEVVEGLSVNKCYNKSIQDIFCEYKSSINITENLTTEIEKLLDHFVEKHNSEYFYSKYFGTIVKESQNYFLGINKPGSTLLASKLGDKILAFFKTPSTDNKKELKKLKPITPTENDALQYLSGYVIRTMLKKAKNNQKLSKS